MEDKEANQRHNYSLVRVYQNNDLRWIRTVIAELWLEGRITTTEFDKIRATLERGCDD